MTNPWQFPDKQSLARAMYQACYLQGTFQLRSGITSQEYLDKYRLESNPDLLRETAERLREHIPAHTEVLAGLEMGGIPIAVMLSQLTGLPCAFVRKEAKTYGTARLAEGAEIENRNVVLVEDVITSGGQVILSAQSCRERGAYIDHVLCVVDRESGGAEALQNHGLTLSALFTLSELKSA